MVIRQRRLAKLVELNKGLLLAMIQSGKYTKKDIAEAINIHPQYLTKYCLLDSDLKEPYRRMGKLGKCNPKPYSKTSELLSRRW